MVTKSRSIPRTKFVSKIIFFFIKPTRFSKKTTPFKIIHQILWKLNKLKGD